MKHTLKNRPKAEESMYPIEAKVYEEWFDGFEKELRKTQYILRNCKTERCLGYLRMVEEILGE